MASLKPILPTAKVGPRVGRPSSCRLTISVNTAKTAKDANLEDMAVFGDLGVLQPRFRTLD
jgi:hypothetical protein